MNHQGLFWNVHCFATVVLRKQLNFKSAVIRSNRSSCFLVLSVTRPKLPLGQMLIHATCDFYSPKAVKTLIQVQCYGYCFLYLCLKYIFFGFVKTLDSKENNKYAKKKVLRQPWNALTLQLSLSLRDK